MMGENETIMREIMRLVQEATGLKEAQPSGDLYFEDDQNIEVSINVGFMIVRYRIRGSDVIVTEDRMVVRVFSMSDPNLFDRISESTRLLNVWMTNGE